MYIKERRPTHFSCKKPFLFFPILTKKRAVLECYIHFKVYLDSLHVFTGNFVSCEIRH